MKKRIYKKIIKLLFIYFITFALALEVDAKLGSTTSYISNGVDKEWRLEGNNNSGERSEYFCLTKNAAIDSTCDSKYGYNDKNFGVNNEKLRAAIGRAIYDYNVLHYTYVSGPNGSPANAGNMYYGIQLVIHKVLAETVGLSNINGSLSFNGLNFTPHYDAAISDYNAYDSAITNFDTLAFTVSNGNYVSNILNPSSGFGTGFSYILTINGIQNNSYLQDYNGGKRIVIPISDVTSDMNVIIKASTTRDFFLADFISCASGKQDIVTTGYHHIPKTIEKELSTTIPPYKGRLTLKKVITGTNTPITSGDVTVAMYSDANCSEDMELNKYNFIGQLSTPLQLEPGTYYFKEIKSPGPSYTMDDKCHKVEIDYGDVEELKIENTSECILDVMNLISTGEFNNKSKRINLYEKYLSKNKNYTNILDFSANYDTNDMSNEEIAANTCKPADCKFTSNKSCLNVSSPDMISDDNWACHTDTIKDSNDNKGYCGTKFDFNSNINLNNISNFSSLGSAKAGQFVFKADNIGTATISQVCYFNTDAQVNKDSINLKKYSDFINNVSFNNQILKSDFDKYPEKNQNIKLDKTGDNKFEGSISINYYMDEVLVEPISGKPCSNNNSCISIGAGLISEFQDGKELENKEYITFDGERYTIVPFKVDFKNENIKVENADIEINDSNNSVCVYKVEPEIIKYNSSENGKLDLEFRAIDTKKPFNRNTNSNWCDESDCKEDNTTVTTYISNRNNSYNKNKQNVLYTNSTNSDKKRIILTPEIIKEIREWNNSHKYDNFELDCDENGNCENAFLKKFKIVKVS